MEPDLGVSLSRGEGSGRGGGERAGEVGVETIYLFEMLLIMVGVEWGLRLRRHMNITVYSKN